jgi:glutamate racemase
MLEVIEELAFLSDRVSFSYLCIVIKKHNLVSALVIACNREGASNISIDKFKWVSSWFKLLFI